MFEGGTRAVSRQNILMMCGGSVLMHSVVSEAQRPCLQDDGGVCGASLAVMLDVQNSYRVRGANAMKQAARRQGKIVIRQAAPPAACLPLHWPA